MGFALGKTVLWYTIKYRRRYLVAKVAYIIWATFSKIILVVMFGKFSLGSFGLLVGGLLTITGFIAYATGNATLNLAGLFYGVPILLGGLALRASELKPVPFKEITTPEILALRDKQATPTQNQIRKDVTRYRYGQEAHLDESLQRLGLSPTDEERPELMFLRETSVDGNYALVLGFDSPLISLKTWLEKQEKIEKFFGPGVKVQFNELEDDLIEVSLITI